jgi:hypothetical protein
MGKVRENEEWTVPEGDGKLVDPLNDELVVVHNHAV